MNIQCPSCQRLLQVPDQAAGQLMKCPLCNGTFTLPGLPPEPAAAAPPAADPFADLGVPAAAPGTDPAIPPTLNNPDPFAAMGAAPPSAPATVRSTPAPAPLPTPPPAGYSKSCTIWFSPQVLQYVAPVAVVLIFFLQFASWVGIYLGGIPVATQSAWGAAFGSIEPDRDVELALTGMPIDSAKDLTDKVGASASTAFYLLLFVLVALPLTIGCLVYEIKPFALPPAVQPFVKFRWGIVAVANVAVLFFLVLQLVFGFALESFVSEQAEKRVAAQSAKTTVEQKRVDILRGTALSALGRTKALQLVVVLHLLAITAAALVYWLEQRGNRPLPKIEMVW